MSSAQKRTAGEHTNPRQVALSRMIWSILLLGAVCSALFIMIVLSW